ncbi:E3 ubiquitin ligase BIG BROTHER-related-like [Rhodamnia argentea]|uniref:E3 ubiquitin ligase BIG BROTHER-related-like n=1 Tax=Rhodamnia argentea TaxID=178133 RepID=A0A8B8NMK4_9MYRT|nr:E3 ubiquitin ligase BIG BROTHER-related-like [Rhodamnia argentea]
MDDGEAKSDSRSRPATPPPPAARNDDDLGPDLAFPLSLLQEKEEREVQEVQEERDRRSAAAALSTIESETEEEEEEASDEESSDYSNEEDRYFYFLWNAFEVELGFPEGEDSSRYFNSLRNAFEGELGFPEGEDSRPGHFDMLESDDIDVPESDDIDVPESDDIDPDEPSYEELIELGEIIEEEKRGLSLEQIGKCFRPYTFRSQSLAEQKNGAIDRCVICQIEYEEGEKLVVLDSCEHPYHSECITHWLRAQKTCPICFSEVSAPEKSLT